MVGGLSIWEERKRLRVGSPDRDLVGPCMVVLGTSVRWSEGALGKMCLKVPRFSVQVTPPLASHVKNYGGSSPTSGSRERGIKWLSVGIPFTL